MHFKVMSKVVKYTCRLRRYNYTISNIDLLKIREKRLYSEYFDNLLSEGFHPKISLPTRLGKTSHTLIDNIITNSKDFGEKLEF